MILVTGGTGFLGSTLIKQLIDQGHAIIATKREKSKIPDFLKSSSLIQWVDADITDYFALANAFKGISKVYHCAAVISYQKKDTDLMDRVNIEGTHHVVNLCIEHRARLVHVSSIAALGTNKQGRPVNEKDKWEFDRKTSKYALSKYKSELEVWRGIVEGLNAVIVNPSLIMGSAAGNKGSGIIFELVNNGLSIYTTGSIGIVDVEDVAKAMILLMERTEIRGERFILNSGNISNKELLGKIASLLNKNAPTKKANPLMLGIGWRLAGIKAFLYGKEPILTEASAHAASSKLEYSNTKIVQTINLSFKPIDKTLKEIAETYTNI